MSERRRVEERLRKKVQEIQSLEKQISEARVYIQALQDVLKMLPKGAGEASSPTILRAGSTVARTREAILANGEPIHIADLLKLLGLEVSRESRASLSGSLSAYVRRGEIFTRPAPNTFGLLELGHHATPTQPPEPPENFGQMEDDFGSPAPLPSKKSDLDDEVPF